MLPNALVARLGQQPSTAYGVHHPRSYCRGSAGYDAGTRAARGHDQRQRSALGSALRSTHGRHRAAPPVVHVREGGGPWNELARVAPECTPRYICVAETLTRRTLSGPETRMTTFAAEDAGTGTTQVDRPWPSAVYWSTAGLQIMGDTWPDGTS